MSSIYSLFFKYLYTLNLIILSQICAITVTTKTIIEIPIIMVSTVKSSGVFLTFNKTLP